MNHPVWDTVGALWRNRRLVGGITASAAVAAVAISLLIPNVYRADARLVLPDSGGGGSFAAALLRNLPVGTSAFLGGGSAGDYARHLTILTSRSMLDSVVDAFDLVEAYDLEKHRTPREAAREELLGNATFKVDEKYEFLSIQIIDRDPERAAAIANFMVERLNSVNAELTAQSAGILRTYVERRYNESLATLDSVMTAMEQYHQRYGVIDLPAQAQGHYEQLARLRAEVIKAEVSYESLREQYGDQNALVAAHRSAARAANQKYARALAGSEAVFPVPQQEMPSLVRDFADLELARMIHTRVLEAIAPMLEQARFDEGRDVQAVQVVDYAVPPHRKFGPRRTFIVLGVTLSSFILSWLLVIVLAWWHRNSRSISARFSRAGQPGIPPSPASSRKEYVSDPADVRL